MRARLNEERTTAHARTSARTLARTHERTRAPTLLEDVYDLHQFIKRQRVQMQLRHAAAVVDAVVCVGHEEEVDGLLERHPRRHAPSSLVLAAAIGRRHRRAGGVAAAARACAAGRARARTCDGGLKHAQHFALRSDVCGCVDARMCGMEEEKQI